MAINPNLVDATLDEVIFDFLNLNLVVEIVVEQRVLLSVEELDFSDVGGDTLGFPAILTREELRVFMTQGTLLVDKVAQDCLAHVEV